MKPIQLIVICAALLMLTSSYAEERSTKHSTGEIIINIEAGKISVNQKELNQEELQRILTKITQIYPDQTVVLRYTGLPPYETLQVAMQACQNTNVQRMFILDQEHVGF